MSFDPNKGSASLRLGRLSLPGATYFITFCTARRETDLTTLLVGSKILHEAKAMDDDCSWQLRCGTIMPDHIHLLITLGTRLPLDRAINRIKAKTSASLRSAGIEWERGFVDHRLRGNDSLQSVLRYIYLNPYRSNPPLIKMNAEMHEWPWFYCSAVDWDGFKDSLESDLPPLAWLQN